MKKILCILCIPLLVCAGQNLCTYPVTEKQNLVDTLWGKAVADPYRWMEDIHSEKVKQWLDEQSVIKDKYASKLADNIAEHLSNYSRIKSISVSKQGKYYLSTRITDVNETPSLYYRFGPYDEPKVLINPNRLGDGVISIEGYTLSKDEKTLAITLAKNGSDWKTIRFIDMDTKELLNDSVRFVKYSPVYWSGQGVFYIQYDVKDVSESFERQINIKALRYHIVGTSQDSDMDAYIPKDKKDDFTFEVASPGNYLILYQRTKLNEKKFNKISARSLPLRENEDFHLFIDADGGLNFNVVGELNSKLIVQTNKNARNGILYKCDPAKLNDFEKFIPQYKERLQGASIINDNKIIALYNGDNRSYAVIDDSAGEKLKTLGIPEGFSFSGFSFWRGDSVLLYYFSSFYLPSSVYKLNVNTFEQAPLMKTIVPFSFSELTTEMVYYKSKDSTIIPMYLTHKKNIKLDGNNPVILYGYGGFGISTEPFFDINNVVFLNSGGLLAVPQLRGGGDYPGWHEAGKRLKKQNTFDDFIAAAEYLVSHKYTNASKIAALGGSNGGLLVTACMTQRPDLFKVVVSQSGVIDMLRYHVYNIGYKYIEEYGNITDSADFENLLKYSPINNLKSDVEYPATLLVASDNDDRVIPFHSFKFLAELQSRGTSVNPHVLYYVANAGHTGSRIFDERMKSKAYAYSFIYKNLGIESKIYFED